MWGEWSPCLLGRGTCIVEHAWHARSPRGTVSHHAWHLRGPCFATFGKRGTFIDQAGKAGYAGNIVEIMDDRERNGLLRTKKARPGGGGGFGTRPRYLIVCLWRRLLASLAGGGGGEALL